MHEQASPLVDAGYKPAPRRAGTSGTSKSRHRHTGSSMPRCGLSGASHPATQPLGYLARPSMPGRSTGRHRRAGSSMPASHHAPTSLCWGWCVSRRPPVETARMEAEPHTMGRAGGSCPQHPPLPVPGRRWRRGLDRMAAHGALVRLHFNGIPGMLFFVFFETWNLAGLGSLEAPRVWHTSAHYALEAPHQSTSSHPWVVLVYCIVGCCCSYTLPSSVISTVL